MNAFDQLFNNEAATALGWTLLHSIWQSLIIYGLITALLRLVSPRCSGFRYAIACAALVLMPAASITTFSLINVPHADAHSLARLSGTEVVSTQPEEAMWTPQTRFPQVTGMLHQYMPVILMAWATGFLFFTFRLTGAILYSQRLTASASFKEKENDWSQYIRRTSESLGIERLVRLAESKRVTSPMVIGYLKPVILAPVGLLSGLSAEQVEAILLHELAHIKRNDYLINLFQSILETIYFFNPFVWKLSGIVRREREYCCDDLVIRHHGAARSYATALAQLAENELSNRAVLALSLGEDRNQLLNRIKRIMETSARKHSPKSRILIPAVLLITGLGCISWLGIHQDQTLETEVSQTQDTVIRKKDNNARYSRRSITTIDENGQPHEEIIETFEGDEALRPMLEALPSIQDDFSTLMQPMPPHPTDPSVAPPPDTLPPPLYGLRNQKEWEVWSQELNENLAEIFALREQDAQQLMERLEEQFQLHDWNALSAPFHFNVPAEGWNLPGNMPDSVLWKLEEELNRSWKLNEEHLKNLEKEFRLKLPEPRPFEGLQEQLRKDGYLSKDETVEAIEWNKNVLKVNGKEINKQDEEKYRKYFISPLDKVE